MEYQSVPVPEILFNTINERDPYTTKIQIYRFGSDRFIAQDDHFDDTEDNGRTRSNKVGNSEDESHDELDSPQQLDYIESNTRFHQENQILLTVESSKSTSVSMIKLNGITSTSTFLQSLLLQYLHKAIINIVCLKPSLLVYLHDNILRYFYKCIPTVVSLLSSLLVSLRSKLLQTSLLTSLRSKFLQSLISTSLRSDFLRSSLLASQWSICLQRLYKDISTVTPIPSKPEIFVQGIHPKPEILLQNIREFTILSKQVNLEASKSWLPLHASLQSCVQLFYEYIGYYVIDRNNNNKKIHETSENKQKDISCS